VKIVPIKDWLKPALLVISLLLIVAVLLYLRREPAPMGSGENPNKLLENSGETPNEPSARSDSTLKGYASEQSLSAEAEADIQQYRKYQEALWRLTKEIAEAEKRIYREHPIGLAKQYARRAYNEARDKYPEVADIEAKWLNHPAERKKMDRLRELNRKLLQPVLFFESLNAADPIGDTTLGELALSILADTDEFFAGKLKGFADAMESADVPANEVAQVRASTTVEELRLLAQKYGPQIMLTYNSQLPTIIPDQKMRMMLTYSYRANGPITIATLYERVWDREIRELRNRVEVEFGPMNDLWNKYPPDSAARSAMATIAHEMNSIAREESTKTSEQQGNTPTAIGQPK
jgi:hypothetical protein